MKIRMDFVTNSSSSSFVAMLNLTLDNGEKITASMQTSQGGEEGGRISIRNTDYALDRSQICSIAKLSNASVVVDGEEHRIQSGALHLMCHAYGEYLYEADAERILTNRLGNVWGLLIQQMNTSHDPEQQFQFLRGLPFLKKYTDASLEDFVCFFHDHGDDSGDEEDIEIIQSLRPDGMLEIEIEAGEGLFEIRDAYDYGGRSNYKKGCLVLQDIGADQKQYFIRLGNGNEYYSGTKDEIEFILQMNKKKYASFVERMERETHEPKSLYGYVTPSQYFQKPDSINFLRDNLDLQEKIVFAGRHFEISNNSESAQFRWEVEREIMKRGGISQRSDYKGLREDTEYLIVSPQHPNFRSAMDIQNAIKNKAKGLPLKIITDYQLWCGLLDKSIPVQSDEEYDKGLMSYIGDKCVGHPLMQKKLEELWKTAYEFREERSFQYAVENLDPDAKIEFMNKHFALSGFYEKEPKIVRQIEERGGFVHDKMVKTADYLVIYMETPDGCKVDQALGWREEGAINFIVSDDQFADAVEQTEPVDPDVLRRRDEGLMSYVFEKCVGFPALQKELERDWKKACVYGYEDDFRSAVENLDVDADISFVNKIFVLSRFGGEGSNFVGQIEERGGSVNERMAKKADYLVINMKDPGGNKLQQALDWRKKGATNYIICEHQLADAVRQTKRVTQKELQKIQNELRLQEERERENARQMKLAQNREQSEAKRLQRMQEAQLRREEEQRKRQEMARRAAEEKLRLKVEQEKEREEKKRAAAAEAKAQKERERQEAIANATILYAPGQEPENIRRRIRTLCEKLDAAYPNRVISGLYNDHKKWGETVTELRRILGYPDNTSLLEAYGYTVEVNENKSGRPATVNPDEVIAELKRRYPNGAGPVKFETLKSDNPDLPWKTLSNNAITYFGETLVAHLKTVGIIGGDETHAPILEDDRDQRQKREETEEVRPDPIEPVEDRKPAGIQPFEPQTLGPSDVELTDAELRCIEAIQELEHTGMAVRSVDVANRLGVSSPAIARQVKSLCEKGVLSKSERGILTVHMPDRTGGKPATPPKTDRELMVKYGLTRSEIACFRAFETCKAASYVAVKNVDIANILGISQARVSIMMSKIRKTGLLSEGSAEVNAEGPVVQGENEEKARREAEENARREAEEKARREAEENARREAEENARREAEEKARREAAPRPASAANASQRVKNFAYSKPGTPNTIRRRQLKAEIRSLEAERDALQGPLGDMKRQELQAWIDELRAELEQLS